VGGSLVRVFLIDGNGVTGVSRPIDDAAPDFNAQHYCEARGNTVTSPKWFRGKHLFLTQVRPRGDCGPAAGRKGRYQTSVPERGFLEHITLNQWKHSPGDCLENNGDKSKAQTESKCPPAVDTSRSCLHDRVASLVGFNLGPNAVKLGPRLFTMTQNKARRTNKIDFFATALGARGTTVPN